MKPSARITQIIPADGWKAVYAAEGNHGDIELHADPLVAWALVTEPDEDEYLDSVQPMVDLGGYVEIASETGGYLGALAPGADIETYRGDAQAYVTELRRKQAKRDAAA